MAAIPTRLPDVAQGSMPNLRDSHNPDIPGSGWNVYFEDLLTGLGRAGLAGFLQALYGGATETVPDGDSVIPGLLKYDGVPPEQGGNTAGATLFNNQRRAWIRRLQALTVSVIKQTLTAQQRISCCPPGAADPLDVDKLWEQIKLYVQGADTDNLAENIYASILDWKWPARDADGNNVAPLSVAALTMAISTQLEYVSRMQNAGDDDYSYSLRQAIRTVVSRSPGELAPFRRAHRECKTLLELQTRMAADMADIRDAPPTGMNALLAAAADQQHPDNTRVLAALRTLLAPVGEARGDRDGRGVNRARRMDKDAGPPNAGETYCKVHGWGHHGDGDCRAQK